MRPHALLIAGPTACGKSALALDLAEALDGVVINADSMQLYRELRLLTARPTPADEARVPHCLYGVLSVRERGSVGRWLALAREQARQAAEAGKTPVVVGGTGLYFAALTEGLARIPEIPEAVRRDSRARLQRLGAAAFHAELARRDPASAGRIAPGDRQRLLRADEVLRATGRALADWQSGAAREPGLAMPWRGYVVDLPRDLLYRRIDARFDAMLAAGVLDEVAALAALGLDPGLPAMRALGVPVLLRHLAGEVDREGAAAAAKQATRRYAKRQMTWFRHKMRSWNWLQAQDSRCLFDGIFSEMRQFGLTS